MPKKKSGEKFWINHRYFRTYEIAGVLADIAADTIRYLSDLEELTVDDRIPDFLPNWQKTTLVHRFAAWVADRMFAADTSGPYVTIYQPQESGEVEQRAFCRSTLLCMHMVSRMKLLKSLHRMVKL
jgi:hypothetical protein